MAEKGKEERVHEQKVGVPVSLAELIGCLALAQIVEESKGNSASCIYVYLEFNFIAEREGTDLRGGIDVKRDTLQDFLMKKTPIREKVERNVMEWMFCKENDIPMPEND